MASTTTAWLIGDDQAGRPGPSVMNLRMVLCCLCKSWGGRTVVAIPRCENLRRSQHTVVRIGMLLRSAGVIWSGLPTGPVASRAMPALGGDAGAAERQCAAVGGMRSTVDLADPPHPCRLSVQGDHQLAKVARRLQLLVGQWRLVEAVLVTRDTGTGGLRRPAANVQVVNLDWNRWRAEAKARDKVELEVVVGSVWNRRRTCIGLRAETVNPPARPTWFRQTVATAAVCLESITGTGTRSGS